MKCKLLWCLPELSSYLTKNRKLIMWWPEILPQWKRCKTWKIQNKKRHATFIWQAMNPPAEWRRYFRWWGILEVRNLCRRDKSLRSWQRRQHVELSRLMSRGRPSTSLSHCLSADFHWTHCNAVVKHLQHRSQIQFTCRNCDKATITKCEKTTD